ncbi:MAG: dTDP-4-dehydrorhamnose reductase [Acidobacteriota bacterium]
MKLLVTGSRGQLGRAMGRAAAARGLVFVGVDLPEFDVTDAAAVAETVALARPDVIVNCAAYTAVDAAEDDEARATEVNGTAVGHLARSADQVGALLVQVSTDYVFDGTARRRYREDDPPRPTSAYGRSKLVGEAAAAAARRHLIVRTAWLFGAGHNFVESIVGQVAAGAASLRVVADQVGCPTYTEDLAATILALVDRGSEGVFHAVNRGEVSWHGFAEEIVMRLGAEVPVTPISTAEAARRAPRPAYGVLDTAKLESLLGAPLPPWQDALGRYLSRRGRG